jgi:hypothetical protein
MMQKLSGLVDWASNYFAHRKGMLPLIGIILIALNLIVASIFPADWVFVRANFLLHIGLILALFGLMLSWAL